MKCENLHVFSSFENTERDEMTNIASYLRVKSHSNLIADNVALNVLSLFFY